MLFAFWMGLKGTPRGNRRFEDHFEMVFKAHPKETHHFEWDSFNLKAPGAFNGRPLR